VPSLASGVLELRGLVSLFRPWPLSWEADFNVLMALLAMPWAVNGFRFFLSVLSFLEVHPQQQIGRAVG
jgi:hypothetical protein